MSTKITPDHLGRTAVVYVRQSTMAQVTGNLESQRRQYDLAGAASAPEISSNLRWPPPSASLASTQVPHWPPSPAC